MTGIAAWLLVGLLVALGARLVAKAARWDRGLPPISAGILGSVLGGFVHDLTIRGDSVLALRGPSLAGSAIGAVLLLAVAYALGWTSSVSRRNEQPPELQG
jgi:uncharacterized membrane protein YeaQ/YmgE (transglycosylase-associated protein family)